MAEILIGTSGYYYDDWVGPVYPEGTKKKDYLTSYSKLFKTVELNFSYYTMPKAENLAKLIADGGPGFSFSIKAHQSMTHKIDYDNWQRDATTYLHAIEPLAGSGRMEAVLFQFPYSFYYNEDNVRYLDQLLMFFKGIPVAVEFRKTDWIRNSIIEGMEKRGVPMVSLDMPELPKLPTIFDTVTAPLAYIRLHGRRKDAWWGKDDHDRYNYEYTDSEVEVLGERVQRLSEKAKRLLVYFNNHPFGKAVRNAQTLEKLLRKLGLIQ